MIKIKIKEKDKVSGFYALIKGDYSIVCLPNNEYIVPSKVLKILEKEKISYEIIN